MNMIFRYNTAAVVDIWNLAVKVTTEEDDSSVGCSAEWKQRGNKLILKLADEQRIPAAVT